MADRAAKTALFDEFARVGKALGSGRRVELLDVLANGERTVEGVAHGGVLLLVGETQLGVAFRAFDKLDAELGLVRDQRSAAGDTADALFGGRFRFGLGHGALRWRLV